MILPLSDLLSSSSDDDDDSFDESDIDELSLCSILNSATSSAVSRSANELIDSGSISLLIDDKSASVVAIDGVDRLDERLDDGPTRSIAEADDVAVDFSALIFFAIAVDEEDESDQTIVSADDENDSAQSNQFD